MPSTACQVSRWILCGEAAPWACPAKADTLTLPLQCVQTGPDASAPSESGHSVSLQWFTARMTRVLTDVRASPPEVTDSTCAHVILLLSLCTPIPGQCMTQALRAQLRPADQFTQHRVLQRQEGRGPWCALWGPKEVGWVVQACMECPRGS